MEGSSSTFDGNFKSFPSDESTSRLYKDSIDDDEVIVPSSNSKSKGKLQQGITQQLLIHKQVPKHSQQAYFTLKINIIEN